MAGVKPAAADDLYALPQRVDDVMLAFPAGLGALLPPLEVIPAEIRPSSA